MPLPDKELTAGQGMVMDPLLTNLNAAKSRLEGAQKLYNEAVLAFEEYIRQAAEKQSIAVGTEYLFDTATKKFIDKAEVEAKAAAIPK